MKLKGGCKVTESKEKPFRVVVEMKFPPGTVGYSYSTSLYKELDFELGDKESAKVVLGVLGCFAQWINNNLFGLIEIKVGVLKSGIITYSAVE